MDVDERKRRNAIASKKWRDNNKKVRKASVAKYEAKNKEKRKEYLKNYRRINRTKLAAYKLKRKQESVQYKIGCYLRTRIYQALQRNRSGSAIKDLGCTLPELKLYLESKWKPGMTWENHSPKGWHIDHIIPLSSFDLTSREQFLKACHYSNLQPLWADDNLSKGSKNILQFDLTKVGSGSPSGGEFVNQLGSEMALRSTLVGHPKD